MEAFIRSHQSQLQQLNIPEVLYQGLKEQLESVFVLNEQGTLDPESIVSLEFSNITTTPYGCMLVLPHICSWDLDQPRGLWEALSSLSDALLCTILRGLHDLWDEDSSAIDSMNREALRNAICDPRVWSRVMLYRTGNSVRAALPSPPYYPQLSLVSEADAREADITGPFPFRYEVAPGKIVETSLGYINPGIMISQNMTIDLVPSYSCPNPLTRAVRLVAFLGSEAPSSCIEKVKEIHANHVKQMHLKRQEKLLREETFITQSNPTVCTTVELEQSEHDKEVWNVYTDADDPMELGSMEAGLSPSHYKLVETPEDADIIYSYRSLFAPGPMKELIERRGTGKNPILINQFPYEGAFVQKDHLGREILNQHGLPRPNWAIETYDLDIQLTEFVGSHVLATERGEDPIWIVKPARGTQSKGHIVTKSLAQIIRLLDAGGESRVVQRYIERPVTIDGRKTDCRCLVMMTNANPPGRPTLYVHNRVFIRIANKPHNVSKPSDLMDTEKVLTATHLLDAEKRTSQNALETLPLDYKTIGKLEQDFQNEGFDWKSKLQPKMHNMIRELFNGMTNAFPAMAESHFSRALYGVDLMFEIGENGIEPKLTEVTFCPSNNALCDAYERDEELFKSFNTDVFDCLFRQKITPNITKIQ